MVELVDTQGSGSCARKGMRVRVPPRPPFPMEGSVSAGRRHVAVAANSASWQITSETRGSHSDFVSKFTSSPPSRGAWIEMK